MSKCYQLNMNVNNVNEIIYHISLSIIHNYLRNFNRKYGSFTKIFLIILNNSTHTLNGCEISCAFFNIRLQNFSVYMLSMQSEKLQMFFMNTDFISKARTWNCSLWLKYLPFNISHASVMVQCSYDFFNSDSMSGRNGRRSNGNSPLIMYLSIRCSLISVFAHMDGSL